MGSELLRQAQRRAGRLRAAYRESGVWSAGPVDVVRFTAARHPTRVAVEDRVTRLTYAELDERVDSACAALVAAGVRPATPVVVVVGNDIDSVVAVHAVMRADAVVLLVPRSSGASQLADIVAGTGAPFGVASDPVPGVEESAGAIAWVAMTDTPANAPAHAARRAADEPSFVLYTSGTTSRPKGVIHSLSTLTKAAANYIEAAGLTSSDRIFLISPLGSVTGVLQAVFIGPMLAAGVVLEDRWDPAATCDFLLASGATWYGGPDRLLDRLLDEAEARGGTVPLRAVYLGGTMLDRRIVTRIEDEFGIVVMRAYGSSEVPVSTSGLRAEPKEVRHRDDGVPLTDVDVRIGSSADPAECCIRGPHGFLGYIDSSDDVVALEDGWFRTGDAAELVDGRLRVVGRLKDIVIRNGMKIPAAEVEEAVTRIAGVRECAAYPVADATTGERLAVAVVLHTGAELTLETVIGDLTAAGLPKYKLPEEIVYWDQPLPVNANGKVERKTLDARAAGRPRALAQRLVG